MAWYNTETQAGQQNFILPSQVFVTLVFLIMYMFPLLWSGPKELRANGNKKDTVCVF